MNAINTFMFSKWSLDKILQLCNSCNIRYVGLSIEHLQNASNTKQLLERYDIHVISVYVLFVSTNYPSLSIEERNNVEKVFEKAAIIRSIYVTVIFKFSQADKEYNNLLSISKELAAISKKTGVKILLEPMHTSYQTFSAICTLEQILFLNCKLDDDIFYWILDICHFSDQNKWEYIPENLMRKLVSVHLANLYENNLDDRSFPAYGKYDVQKIMKTLSEKGFKGYRELEVISPMVLQMNEEQIKREVFRTFPPNILVIGELALHEFVSLEESYTFTEDMRQVGGGAAMILRQLDKLGIQASSLTITGNDELGLELGEKIKLYSPENIHIYQEGSKTSHVKLMVGKEGCNYIEIISGTVCLSQIEQSLNKFNSFEGICYCPYFPGYENIIKKMVTDKKKRVVLDFGFYDWCGKFDLIINQLKKAPNQIFLAVINAKDMSNQEKKEIENLCKYKRYEMMILTDGAKKVWGYDKERRFVYCPEEVKEICNCGAGDVTIAGIMAKLAQGKSLKEALTFGARLAKAKVQKLGV